MWERWVNFTACEFSVKILSVKCYGCLVHETFCLSILNIGIVLCVGSREHTETLMSSSGQDSSEWTFSRSLG